MAEHKPRADGAPPPTADAQRLRHDIDSGRTGDKIPAADPAAAPLGTDDEAAGTRPTGGVRPPRVPSPPGHEKGGEESDSGRGLGVAVASTLAVVVVVLAVVMAAT